jgi:cephalosporin-C deacetylase
MRLPDSFLIPKHGFDFDPVYGLSPSSLRAIQLDEEEPEGFADFWQRVYQAALEVPLELQIQERTSDVPGCRLLQVSYRVYPDYRVGAWIYLPESLPPRIGVVCGHGYGGRAEGPEPGLAGPDRAVIFPVAPGFHISADDRLPRNDCYHHVVHGIESPETYILGSCAATLWRAVDVLGELCDGLPEHLHYRGWSFGGGMGALMLPWEPRYQTAELGQVTFAHHPFRLRHACVGSGHAVRQRWLKDPAIEKTLAFFEAVFTLRRLKIPTVFACACFDPAVPPPGQWAAANAHPGPKRISEFPTGHFDAVHPDEEPASAAHDRNILELIGIQTVVS